MYKEDAVFLLSSITFIILGPEILPHMIKHKILGLGLALALAIPTWAQDQKVKLSEIWRTYSFYAQGVSGLESMNDGLHYTSLTNGTLEKFEFATGESAGVITSVKEVSEAAGKDIKFDGYSFSSDEKQLLLATATEPIYRHSTRSTFYIYNLETKKVTQLAEGKQRYATFNPQGTQVAYVMGNNLHVYDLASGKTTKVTSDGKYNHIINGATDWVYEEEFAFDKAFFWAPDGKTIAFYRFDETAVPTFSMDVYGSQLYPTQDVFKYPKAGEDNAIVTAWLYAVGGEVKPVTGLPDYEYIPRIKWTQDANKVVIYTTNRHQNELVLNAVDASTGAATVLYTEKDEAYVDVTDDIRFLKDGSFIWTSEKDGYNHIYLIDKKGKEKRQITKGEWDVTKFYGIDAKEKTLYYQSAEVHPSERNIYSISIKGRSKKTLSPKKGWNTATFSQSFDYYINNHSAAGQPTYVSLNDKKGSEIRVLQDNAGLRKRLDNYSLSKKEFFYLETEAGITLSAWMIKPTDFDETKQYPVLMHVYGGPGAQTVENSYDPFNDFWYQTLADQGYIIVSVDNRGTGARGRDFKKVTYKELGKYEVEDQIAAAVYLGKLPYVDATRIGIWGWSYGGYMSSLCITKGADVFKTAIAVAPVTNWRFYDSVYTERYMQTPQENASGYDENSPINHVKLLKGNYLLVHGSADDNVHVQNTMRMVEALVQANVQFDLFIYPDKNHGIFGGNTRYHLYEKMTNYVLENL